MEALKSAIADYLSAREELRTFERLEKEVRGRMQELQSALNTAFREAAKELPEKGTSFVVSQGNTCYTFIFSDGKLQTVVESPLLSQSS